MAEMIIDKRLTTVYKKQQMTKQHKPNQSTIHRVATVNRNPVVCRLRKYSRGKCAGNDN